MTEPGHAAPTAAPRRGIIETLELDVRLLGMLMAFAAVTQAESAEPFVLIHVRPSEVPDKPPRV